MLTAHGAAQELAPFVARSKPRIQGPFETDYGMGWSPTLTFWVGGRRVHLYDDFNATDSDCIAVEIAGPGKGKRDVVKRCHLSNIDQVRDLIQRFLCETAAFDELTMHEWVSDALDHDKFIPHPPETDNPSNIGACWNE